MDNKTLEIILGSAPQIIGAVFSGIAAVVATWAYKKGTSNGRKADFANQQISELKDSAKEISDKTDKLHEISDNTRLANEKIRELNAFDAKKAADQLFNQTQDLLVVKTDISDIKKNLAGIRQRQHDMANYMNRDVSKDVEKFVLAKIEESKGK